MQDNGINSLPYCGEMDAKSNYMKWKNDEIKKSSSAFRMGIDEKVICHVVYGVLTNGFKSLQRWTFTIYYSMDNTNHVMAWIRDCVSNADYCKQLLEGFSSSWKYAMANLAEKCQCEIFLDAFGEECIQDADVHSVTCCDVCNMNPHGHGRGTEYII